jgi:hypothetical protein
MFAPGHPDSPGTRGVPLWYFSNVASYKATRDFTKSAISLPIRTLLNAVPGFNKEMALSKSSRIKRATSLRGARLLNSTSSSVLSSGTVVTMGKSP